MAVIAGSGPLSLFMYTCKTLTCLWRSVCVERQALYAESHGGRWWCAGLCVHTSRYTHESQIQGWHSSTRVQERGRIPALLLRSRTLGDSKVSNGTKYGGRAHRNKGGAGKGSCGKPGAWQLPGEVVVMDVQVGHLREVGVLGRQCTCRNVALGLSSACNISSD